MPAWSPDGRRIAFLSDQDGGQIYAVNADGSGLRKLASNPFRNGGWGLLWSPDGRKLAFVSNRDGNDEIYTVNANGSGQRRLTRTPAVESLLSWSPDGRKLAFYRFPVKPRWAFFVMNADGSRVRKVNWSLPGRKG